MMDMTINSFSQINITAAPDPNGSVYAELFQSLTNMLYALESSGYLSDHDQDEENSQYISVPQPCCS